MPKALSIAVVTSRTRHSNLRHLAPNVTFHHRRELDAVQRELREVHSVPLSMTKPAPLRNAAAKRGKPFDPQKRLY
jgi:indolepyruvate ferredoxin oxidoreductase